MIVLGPLSDQSRYLSQWDYIPSGKKADRVVVEWTCATSASLQIRTVRQGKSNAWSILKSGSVQAGRKSMYSEWPTDHRSSSECQGALTPRGQQLTVCAAENRGSAGR